MAEGQHDLGKIAVASVATAGRLIRLENSIFDEWPAEDVQQYLGLMERYLQAFRRKLPELGGQE